MSIWLVLVVTIAALVVGYVFGTRQLNARISIPELARLWEQHLLDRHGADGVGGSAAEGYRQGLRDMGRALVIGDPPPPDA
ncbi:MAG: hypothetical protein RIM84_09100 [Alphaproteobacteria bacterium]